VTERAPADGPPPRGTAAYDAYLREMLNATTQGIAPGVGSVSEAGEPARRTGPRDLTLAEKLRDGFTPGRGARGVADGPREPRLPSIGDLDEEERRLLRNMEPAPISGPGARMFEVTPDEESFWAAIAPDEFISEELIEIHRRGEFNDEDVAIMEEYSPEAGQRAELIAYYDQQGVRGSNDADALRAGATLPEGTWGIGVPQPIEDAGRWMGDEFIDAQRQQNEFRERIFDEGRDALNATVEGGQNTLGGLITRGGEAIGALGWELSEFGDVDRIELRDRLTEMTRGLWSGNDPALATAIALSTRDPSALADNQFRDAIEGLFGNDTFDASEQPLIAALPEDSAPRDFAEAVFNDASDPAALMALMAIASGFAVPWVGAALGGGAYLTDDLLSEDSDYAEPIAEHLLPRLLDAINPPVLPKLPIR
jgi:hypothetical protein